MRLIGWTRIRGLPQASMAHGKRMFLAYLHMQPEEMFLACVVSAGATWSHFMHLTKQGLVWGQRVQDTN